MPELFTGEQLKLMEQTLYFFLVYIILGKIFHSLLRGLITALEPSSKKKDKRDSLETPIRLLLGTARCVAWISALVITSVIFNVMWFEGFFLILFRSTLLCGGIVLILYIISRFDPGFRKTMLSLFGYWYIRYHQKIQKNQQLKLHFKDNSSVTVKEIYLLHTICIDEKGRDEKCYSNAELLLYCFNLGKQIDEDLCGDEPSA